MAINQPFDPYGQFNLNDPNAQANRSVPLEDLNIYVQLETTSRARSVLTTTVENEGVLGPITFIQGNPTQGESRSMDTDWTNMGSFISSQSHNKDINALGIESINIEFNSAYIPLITINFIDVRGASIFEKGNDSKYRVFFELPYPLFNLTVKGFYGEAVTYCLHMTKWVSKFNSRTGNFEIKSEFIGYTYAFLTDMLVGYLKGAAETEIGSKLLESKGVMSLTQLFQVTKNVGEEFKRIANQNKDYVKFQKLQNDSSLIDKGIDRIKKLHSFLVKSNQNLNSVKGGQLIMVKSDGGVRNTNEIEINSVKADLKSYNDAMEDLSEYGIDLSLLETFSNFYYKDQSFDDVINNSRIKNEYKPSNKDDYKSLMDVYYLDPIRTNLDELKEKINKDMGSIDKKLQGALFNSLQKGLGFEPTIRSLFKILIAHVDVFMTLMYKVSESAELDSSKSREGELKKIKNSLDINEKVGSTKTPQIYPWPTYEEDGVEKYIGSLRNIDSSSIPELSFVEELLTGMIESKKVEENTQLYYSNTMGRWYPVSIIDTPLFNSGDSPYKTPSLINDDLIRKLILLRAVTFLGVSNDTKKLSKEEIISMGKLEANNIFNNVDRNLSRLLVNGKVKSPDGILNEGVSGNDKWKNTSTNKILELKDGEYRYSYVTKDKHTIIPFDSPYNGQSVLNDEKSKSMMVGSAINFPSVIKTNEVYLKIFYPEDYQKSIPYADYGSKGEKGDNKLYSESNGNGYLIFDGTYKIQEFFYYENEDNIKIGDDNSKPLPMFSMFYSKRFDGCFNIKNEQDETNFRHYVLNIPSSKMMLINPQFMVNNTPIDLFGSYLYFAQKFNGGTNLDIESTRALLFLHTLPFNGMNNDGDGLFSSKGIKGLFNTRSGFIEVPKIWAVFLGGLIYRSSGGVDRLVFQVGSEKIFNDGTDGVNSMTVKNHPTKTQYLRNTDETFSFKLSSQGHALNIEDVILNLPTSVKSELMGLFLAWVNDNKGWKKIKKEFEFVNFDSIQTIDDWKNLWTNYHGNTDDFLPYGFTDKYSVTKGQEFNFNIEMGGRITNPPSILNDNTSIKSGIIKELLTERIILGNASYRIWRTQNEGVSKDITVNKTAMVDYLKGLTDELTSLIKDTLSEDDKAKNAAFGTIDNDMIKLNIYRNLKAIYDKWIAGGSNSDCIGWSPDGGTLLNKFEFIDRAYNDIGDKFIINPLNISNYIEGDLNRSIYDVISRVLTDNNFNFFPLPNYLDLSENNVLQEKVFHPFPRVTRTTTEQGPKFVCMYVGNLSHKLNLGSNSDFKNDGFYVEDGFGAPPDITDSKTKIPLFIVRYGDQNQSIFKDVQLDQSEYSETDESLKSIEIISQKNGPKVRTLAGQNLWNVFSTRSYSVEVEMLGNMMIQPLMYFQLANVPMWRGVYLIYKVSHEIKPHYITTKFKGMRLAKVNVPLLTQNDIFANLLGYKNEHQPKGENVKQNRIKNKQYVEDIPYDSSEVDVNIEPQGSIDVDNSSGAITIDNSKIDPEELALLDTIAFAEGTLGRTSHNGYDLLFRTPELAKQKKNRVIANYNEVSYDQGHLGSRWRVKNGDTVTSAAGRYQFQFDTWVEIGGSNKPFTATNQDLNALKLASKRGGVSGRVLKPVENNFDGFIDLISKLQGIWQSFELIIKNTQPNSTDYYNISRTQLFEYYKTVLGKYKNLA